MAKKDTWYFLKVGVKLFLIGIITMIVSWLISLPLNLLVGMATRASGAIVAGFSLMTVINIFIGFLVMGYFVVKWKTWLFKNSWV